MPTFANSQDRTVASAMERWKMGAHEQVISIGSLRDTDGNERVWYYDWDKEKPYQNFDSDTVYLTSIAANDYPPLDSKCLGRLADAIRAWHRDHNADRVPPQAVIENWVEQAHRVLETVWM